MLNVELYDLTTKGKLRSKTRPNFHSTYRHLPTFLLRRHGECCASAKRKETPACHQSQYVSHQNTNEKSIFIRWDHCPLHKLNRKLLKSYQIYSHSPDDGRFTLVTSWTRGGRAVTTCRTPWHSPWHAQFIKIWFFDFRSFTSTFSSSLLKVPNNVFVMQ